MFSCNLVILFLCLTVCANRTPEKSFPCQIGIGNPNDHSNKELHLIDSLVNVISDTFKIKPCRIGIGDSEGFLPNTLDIQGNIVSIDTFYQDDKMIYRIRNYCDWKHNYPEWKRKVIITFDSEVFVCFWNYKEYCYFLLTELCPDYKLEIR